MLQPTGHHPLRIMTVIHEQWQDACSMRAREFAAIPLVVALLGFVGLILLAVYTGPWAWFLLVAFTAVAAGFLLWWYSKRHPHSVGDAPRVAGTMEQGHTGSSSSQTSAAPRMRSETRSTRAPPADRRALS